jgi:RNA polymerase sigma-54 factor
MRFQTGLSQRAEVGLLLLPKMLQSIEVLQLTTADLVQLIDRELMQNETLEVKSAPSEPQARADGRAGDEPDWDEVRLRRGADPEDAGKQELLANVPAASDRLMEHIREQLAWQDLAPALRDRVLALAELLDEHGFLQSTAEQELDEASAEALRILRSLEPRGLGARNAVEALLMQVPPADPDYADIRALLTQHLEGVAHNKLPEVARRLGRSLEELNALLDRVRGLDPFPAATFRDGVAQPIRPDVYVWLRDGELEIAVNDRDLPVLGLNRDYAAMARAPQVSAEVKRYLRPKLDSARGLMHALEQRRSTLLRVSEAIMRHQMDFLREGVTAIRPLKMAEIASALDLHTSTISRAVAGKHVQTDRGIYALRMFFDGRRTEKRMSQSAPAGRRGIQERIQLLIEGELPERPLSDNDLVTLLVAGGVEVARRTVTKYRKELGIPSSWRRRRHRAD